MKYLLLGREEVNRTNQRIEYIMNNSVGPTVHMIV